MTIATPKMIYFTLSDVSSEVLIIFGFKLTLLKIINLLPVIYKQQQGNENFALNTDKSRN